MSEEESTDVVKVISTETEGGKTLVKIEVPSYKALEVYKPVGDQVQVTVAVASKSVPEKDVEMIRALCYLNGYTYEGARTSWPWSKSSAGEASSTSQEEKKE